MFALLQEAVAGRGNGPSHSSPSSVGWFQKPPGASAHEQGFDECFRHVQRAGNIGRLRP